MNAEKSYDVAVIGGGPAGMAAAISAYDNGTKRVLLLERLDCLGGILNQCIHTGFGLHYFNQELTGPEYAERFISEVASRDIDVMTATMVLSVSHDKTVTAVNPKYGCFNIHASAIILAMGCRERVRGAIGITGSRPSGIFTAGAAQLFLNIAGFMVGKRVVILGSGDIGLIMARRLTLEGAKVLGVYEIMPYSGGLARNIAQCLEDYGIPLYLSHTITEIRGKKRLEQVVTQAVDADRNLIAGTQRVIDCDTLLLSVGLIPENELTRTVGIEIEQHSNGAFVHENLETSLSGVFACGNALHVHDLADNVTKESMKAGQAAADYINGKARSVSGYINDTFTPPAHKNIGSKTDGQDFKEMTCIVCPKGCRLTIDLKNDNAVSGNACPRGILYAKKELSNPTRTITSTVSITGAKFHRLPVKTDGEIPKDKIFDVMKLLKTVTVAAPVTAGDIICKNIPEPGINLVATRSAPKA